VQSEALLGDLRRELEAEKAQLTRRLAELGYGGSGSLSFDHNFADSSQVTAERAEVEALAKSLQESLGEVEDALAKFDAGTYGKCESCGQDIATARLEAAPAARLCINCASRR
jgi:DnaK suppressor protein